MIPLKLKLAIVVLSLILIAVILIPGKILDQAARELAKSHENMLSIYKSEKYLKRLNNRFTEDTGGLNPHFFYNGYHS
jgi:hypothetical protein